MDTTSYRSESRELPRWVEGAAATLAVAVALVTLAYVVVPMVYFYNRSVELREFSEGTEFVYGSGRFQIGEVIEREKEVEVETEGGEVEVVIEMDPYTVTQFEDGRAFTYYEIVNSEGRVVILHRLRPLMDW